MVQRYISRPYLIDNLKFDLRIYVLLAGVDPLKVFIYNEGLARFATEGYIAPSWSNLEEVCMHLTNYAINKDNNKFIFNESEKNMDIGHKRSLQATYEVIKERGGDVKKLKEKIEDIIVKTFISGGSHLKFTYKSCQNDNLRNDMCFEVLGFDIMLT